MVKAFDIKTLNAFDPLTADLTDTMTENDRLWRITGPNFVAGMTDYNWEVTSSAPILRSIFKEAAQYSGNAWYIVNEAVERGWKVESRGWNGEWNRYEDRP